VKLWLSKISSVHLVAGASSRTVTLGHGPHTLTLGLGRHTPPGEVTPTLTATDLAGNETDTDLAPVTVAWDTQAPTVDASLAGRTLQWTGTDPGTPWLHLALILRGGGSVRALQLGRHRVSGSLTLKPPSGSWDATLVAANSAGKRTRIALGNLN
jgi:hypothetical protein